MQADRQDYGVYYEQTQNGDLVSVVTEIRAGKPERLPVGKSAASRLVEILPWRREERSRRTRRFPQGPRVCWGLQVDWGPCVSDRGVAGVERGCAVDPGV